MKAATLYFDCFPHLRLFQSTPPVKAATNSLSHSLHNFSEFQSTPPVKAATEIFLLLNTNLTISIHAAREGGDCKRHTQCLHWPISIHAAREGGDVCFSTDFPHVKIFQSTPPVKAATRAKFLRAKSYIISIHAAREGGDSSRVRSTVSYIISIHAAREGGDLRRCCQLYIPLDYFNPRRP